jgi:hypothetical protein
MKKHKDHRGSTGEERQRWHELGVSEVIGVVLVLALVVVGGTIVGTQLLSQPSPKEIPNVNFLANYNPGNLTLYHTGGDTLPNGDYKFVVQYLDGTKSQTFNATKDWSSGSPLTFPAISQPAKVTLVYTGNGAGETALRSVVMGDQGSDVGAGTTTTTSTGIPTTVTTTPTGTVLTTETTIPITITTAPTTTVPTTVPTTVITTPTVTPTILSHTINVTSGLYGQVQANDQTVAAGTSGTVSVLDGGQVNFTFTPTIGFHLANVNYTTDTGESGTFPAVENAYTLANVIRNYSVTANFAINTYTITATAGDQGSISPEGTQTVNYGDSKTFTITPETGYHLGTVTVDGTTVTPAGNTYTFTNIQSDHTITATFAANVYTVNVTSGLNGSVLANTQTVAAGTSGTVNVNYNGEVNFTYLPTIGHHIDTVTYTAEDGSQKQLPIVDNTSVLSGIKSNTTVIANFAVDQFTITVAPPVHGSITPSGTQTVDYNGTPTFTFTPDTGYHLGTVTVDGTPVTPAGNTYTFPPVTRSHTLAATFVVDTFTINASAGNNGAINPNGAVPVNYGDSKDFTITANTGYHINGVTVDSTPQTVPAGNTSYQYTFTNIQTNHSINASFGINTYTINATAGEHGTITPSGTQTVNYGDSRTFTITPATGYTIADVKVDGASQGAVTTYALNNIQSDHTITATFTQITYTITAIKGPLGNITPYGSQSYPYHAAPTYSITPITGYHVTSIMVDDQVVSTSTTTYTFPPLEGDHTINASFAKNQYTIIAIPENGGTISPPGTTWVYYGDSQSFTITPDPGNKIDNVFIDDIPVDALSSITLTNISANHTLEAVFDINNTGPYSIEGNVWNDPDGMGNYESHGSGLQGWIITASIDNGQNAGLHRTLVTDETGYYKFENLPRGHYHVVETAQIGWDQTFPTQHNGYYIDNLNNGRADKHQHVMNVDFMNVQTGSYLPGTEFHLQASRPGYLVKGGYISFTVTGLDSWVDIKGNSGIVTRYPISVSDTVKIELTSNSTVSRIDAHSLYNNVGQLDPQALEIDLLNLTAVNLFKNGNLVATGSMDGSSNIYVRSCTNYQSTLQLKVPAPDSSLTGDAVPRYSFFQVDSRTGNFKDPDNPSSIFSGEYPVPNRWTYNYNNWEYDIYNLGPDIRDGGGSGQTYLGEFHLNSNAQALGEFYGGGSGYQMIGTS